MVKPINEETALHVTVELIIDRETSRFRWVTRGMDVNDFKEQDLVCRSMRAIVELSEKESEEVNARVM